MIKVKHVVILAFLLGILPFCGKNPVETIADDNEERILFIRSTRDFSEICTMSPEGSDIQVIAHYDYGDDYYWRGYFAARWSSDKTMLVVEGGPGSTKEYWPLWNMVLEGKLLKQLTWNGHEPFWTRDDETIIYTRRRGYFSETWDVYRINVSTLAEDTLLWAETGPPGSNSGYLYQLHDVFPSEDTKLLLRETYTYQDSSGKQTDDDAELVIYNVLTRVNTYLTDNEDEEGWAKVSPDGNRIFFTRKNHGVYPYYTNNLYLMNADGDSVHQLTTGTTEVYSHILGSPDGNYLVFKQADQSDGYNHYGDLFIFDMLSGAIDTLLVRVEEEMSYIPVDWK